MYITYCFDKNRPLDPQRDSKQQQGRGDKEFKAYGDGENGNN